MFCTLWYNPTMTSPLSKPNIFIGWLARILAKLRLLKND